MTTRFATSNGVSDDHYNLDADLRDRLISDLQDVIEDGLRYSSVGTALSVEAPWLDRIVLTAGHQDREQTRPLERGNLFQIGSQTKIFTAALILRLIKEGRLSLSSRVVELIPEFPGHVETEVRHLLMHTSGLGNPSYFLDPIEKLVNYPLTFEERMMLAKVKRISGPLGHAWEYNNAGYWTLGRIVEVVTGEPLGAYLRKALLEPLGMNDTYIGSEDNFPVERMARGYHIERGGEMPIETTHHLCLAESGAAGDMVSSADDMIIWLGSLLADDPATGVSMADLIQEFVSCGDQATTNAVDYGLGVMRFVIGGRSYWGHGGAMCGYMGQGFVHEESGLRLCVLSNKITRPNPDWLSFQMVGFTMVSVIAQTLHAVAPEHLRHSNRGTD